MRRALREDIGDGDLTTESIVGKEKIVDGKIILKESAVLSGLEIPEIIFNELGEVKTELKAREGTWTQEGIIITFSGDARAILMGERVALNFIQRMSGISTLTRKFVEIIEGTDAEILDTRKTSPGLRYFQKYAVEVGGGQNHRMGLYDRVLIKENHIKIAGGIPEALSKSKGEIEVKNYREAEIAINSGAKHLLLDNMTVKEVNKIIGKLDNGNIIFEYSGGVNLDNIEEIARTGIDYISVGALTHSYKSIDISLIIE